MTLLLPLKNVYPPLLTSSTSGLSPEWVCKEMTVSSHGTMAFPIKLQHPRTLGIHENPTMTVTAGLPLIQPVPT